MIPKIIHYCWFGGNPLPPLAIKCIESWKKYLPDYEIKEWNESNFDVNMNSFVREAYIAKKYAFVSDYARFYVLYKYGGLYFDTDVEVIKNMDDIIARGPFMGIETDDGDTSLATVAPGLGLGVNPGLGLYKDVIEIYNKKHFSSITGRVDGTVVTLMTKVLSNDERIYIDNGVYKCGEIFLYATDYFCPKDYITGELNITDRTVSIHHYDSSWVDESKTLLQKVKKRYPLIKARILSSLGCKA